MSEDESEEETYESLKYGRAYKFQKIIDDIMNNPTLDIYSKEFYEKSGIGHYWLKPCHRKFSLLDIFHPDFEKLDERRAEFRRKKEAKAKRKLPRKILLEEEPAPKKKTRTQQKKSRNPYDVLKLPRNSPMNVVSKTFRQLSLKQHPDRVGGNAELFQEISAAYLEIKSRTQRRVTM